MVTTALLRAHLADLDRVFFAPEIPEKKLRAARAAFYEGKIASARWFADQVLPGLTLARKRIEGSDLALMSMADESF